MEAIQLPHKLILNERKSLTMTGVIEVIGFDETTVLLHTHLGTLEIRGQGLVLKALSAEGGQMAVEGHICGLFYTEPQKPGGFWSRLLK